MTISPRVRRLIPPLTILFLLAAPRALAAADADPARTIDHSRAAPRAACSRGAIGISPYHNEDGGIQKVRTTP